MPEQRSTSMKLGPMSSRSDGRNVTWLEVLITNNYHSKSVPSIKSKIFTPIKMLYLLPSDGDWRDTTVGLRRQSFEDPKVEMGLEKQLDDDEEEEEDCVDGLKVWNVRSKRQLSIFLALILSPLFPNGTSFSTSSLQNSQSKTCWLAGLDWLGWASRLGCLLFSLNWTNNWSYHSILHICRLPEVFAIFGAI